jgi:hypothetical protein
MNLITPRRADGELAEISASLQPASKSLVAAMKHSFEPWAVAQAKLQGQSALHRSGLGRCATFTVEYPPNLALIFDLTFPVYLYDVITEAGAIFRVIRSDLLRAVAAARPDLLGKICESRMFTSSTRSGTRHFIITAEMKS